MSPEEFEAWAGSQRAQTPRPVPRLSMNPPKSAHDLIRSLGSGRPSCPELVVGLRTCQTISENHEQADVIWAAMDQADRSAARAETSSRIIAPSTRAR